MARHSRPRRGRDQPRHRFRSRPTEPKKQVAGKGGLVREVLLPHRLAHRLEERRLEAPERVVDCGVRYLQRYDVGGGQSFSASFSRASVETLGKSRGAHGIRSPNRGCGN